MVTFLGLLNSSFDHFQVMIGSGGQLSITINVLSANKTEQHSILYGLSCPTYQWSGCSAMSLVAKTLGLVLTDYSNLIMKFIGKGHEVQL